MLKDTQEWNCAESKIPGEAAGNAWYAIRVRNKFERAVSAGLAGKGCDEYLPLYRSTRNWSDRSKDLSLPLFPGYLFCRFDIQVRLPVLTTPGVISILGIGKTPVAVPDREIDAIRTMVHSGLVLLPWPQLVVGSRVVIEKGPLEGIEGVTMEIKKKQRLVVSVPLLQRSVAVEIDRAWIRLLPAGKAAHSISPTGAPPNIAKVA